MNPSTLEALKASIEKWELKRDDAHPREVRLGPRSCPLCTLFYSNSPICAGCPVRERTGLRFCDGSPYADVLTFQEELTEDDVDLDKWKSLCQAEIDFLKSLLPKDQ